MKKTQFLLVAAASALVATAPAMAADFKVGDDTVLTIGGLLAVGVKSSGVTNVQPADTANPRTEFGVQDNTSRVIFAGSSEFFPGWKGVFYIESRFTTNVSPIDPLMPGLPPGMAQQYTAGNMTGWANGTTYGGIQTPYGRLVFGKSTLYYLDGANMDYLGVPGPGEGYRAWDAGALGVFSMLSQVGTVIRSTQLGNATIAALPLATLQIDRCQNVIRYDSPAVAGFNLALAYTKNPFGQSNVDTSVPASSPTNPVMAYPPPRAYNAGGTFYANLRYNNGPFTAFASVLSNVMEGGLNNSLQEIYIQNLLPGINSALSGAYKTNVNLEIQGPMDTHAYRFGAGYKFGGCFRAGFVYDYTSVDNGIIGTTLTAARHTLEVPLSYEWGKNRAYATYHKVGDTSNIAMSGCSMETVGYDYAFTKKMFAGVFFTSLHNDVNGIYQPFLTGTVLGNTPPLTGESWHQISVDINWWF